MRFSYLQWTVYYSLNILCVYSKFQTVCSYLFNNYNPKYESSRKELLFIKGGLRYVFAWELEVFYIAKPYLMKRAILLKAEARWQH